MALSNFKVPRSEFVVEGVLFDMDGTLTDSIAAVESAWTKVAEELEMPPAEVIAATHGKRAIDNLRDLKPHLRRLSTAEMAPHVDGFEKLILSQADEYTKAVEEVKSRRNSSAGNSRNTSRKNSIAGPKPGFAGFGGLSMTMTTATASPLANASPLSGGSGSSSASTPASPNFSGANTPGSNDSSVFEEDEEDEKVDVEDRSVRILPGVKRMIQSIPDGRYAVATSGAKIYCHGCLTRVEIQPPPVTITADHPSLRRGKPFPDPFLLAAQHLGFPADKCLVVEDSPSGIKAGVASGATVIAVCTSHPREKIEHCGAQYIVPSLDNVRVHVEADGRLRIIIDNEFPHDSEASKPINAHSLNSRLAAEVITEVRELGDNKFEIDEIVVAAPTTA